MSKWILNIGCHRGTLMSRDATNIECASLQECREKAMEQKAGYASIGYSLWFAEAISPEGVRTKLLDGVPYR